MSQLPQFAMAVGPRVRQSAFFDATVAAGVKSFTIYNHMYLPVHFGDPLAEYWGMVEGVILADHSAQRQIEITGPDALELVQLLTPREMSTLAVGRGRYVVFTDHNGGIINDAVLLRVEDDKYWLSPGDGDVILWAQGIALGRGLDVSVAEPDISPLQLQGPLSPHVAKKLFGEIAVTMGYYHCHELELNGIPVVLTRTGWSGELGYEIYLLDGSCGNELWDLIMAAGEEHGIIPACPSLPRSVEGGILSYVSDITRDDTPFTIGLERLIDVDKPSDYIGKAALQRLAKEPTPRNLVGANFGGEPVGSNDKFWDVYSDDDVVGRITRCCYSPRLEHNIALVNVPTELAEPGTKVKLDIRGELVDAEIVALPWFESHKTIPEGI
jgi:glycine cleavage system aminomethyltransferase T